MTNRVRLRGNTAARLTIVQIARLPSRAGYAKLTLAQRRTLAGLHTAKAKSHYLSCKWLQQTLARKYPSMRSSMSHTNNQVVIAQARTAIGVDAERGSELLCAALVGLMAANPFEADWARGSANRPMQLWLAKEARFKTAANYCASFDPQAIPVRNAFGWIKGIRFEQFSGLQIAIYTNAARAKPV